MNNGEDTVMDSMSDGSEAPDTLPPTPALEAETNVAFSNTAIANLSTTIIDFLAVAHDEHMLTKVALAKSLHVAARTIQRMVNRYELPPPNGKSSSRATKRSRSNWPTRLSWSSARSVRDVVRRLHHSIKPTIALSPKFGMNARFGGQRREGVTGGLGRSAIKSRSGRRWIFGTAN